MNNNIKNNKTNIFVFLGFYCLFLVTFFVLSVFTSSGWTMMAHLVYGGGVCLFLIFLALVLSFDSIKSGRKHIQIPASLTIFILFLSTLLILFNFGDCGDNTMEAGNFIQRVTMTDELCTNSKINDLLGFHVIFAGFLFNYVLIMLLGISVLNRHNQNKLDSFKNSES